MVIYMQKVRIKIKINDYIIDEIGFLNNNVIQVEASKEIIKFDYKNNVLEKQDNDLRITMDFNNKKIKYELLNENNKFYNKLILLSLTNDNKTVIINYQIEETNFLLKITYEPID